MLDQYTLYPRVVQAIIDWQDMRPRHTKNVGYAKSLHEPDNQFANRYFHFIPAMPCSTQKQGFAHFGVKLS
jgi:hypothetical protein